MTLRWLAAPLLGMLVSCSVRNQHPPVLPPEAPPSDRLLAGMNHVRKLHGKPPLQREARLTRAAQKHADWMAKTGKFQHAGAGGKTFQHRLSKEGYPLCYSAENLALSHDSSRVVPMWMKSKGHRKNILNKRYTRVGIGISGRYWVANYAEFKPHMAHPDLPPPSVGVSPSW